MWLLNQVWRLWKQPDIKKTINKNKWYLNQIIDLDRVENKSRKVILENFLGLNFN
jgi:hypothetical protein